MNNSAQETDATTSGWKPLYSLPGDASWTLQITPNGRRTAGDTQPPIHSTHKIMPHEASS